jgi:DNA repair exonuclease SbcCD ATPase subunit
MKLSPYSERLTMKSTGTGLEAWRKKIDGLKVRHQLAVKRVQQESQSLCLAREEVENVQQAQEILQRLAQAVQTRSHRGIARIVSRCLSAVFDNPYDVQIEFERKRGRTEARFVYYRDGNKLSPLVTSKGVLDVVSLALRLASLILAMPSRRRLLVLDEPFRGLAGHNLQKVAKLVELLSQELGIQFVIITHSDQLQIGKVVELCSPT